MNSPCTAPKSKITKIRTPAQEKAYDEYKFTEQRADRYCGSIFVTEEGMARWEALVAEKYQACKALGMGVEHGL